MASAKGIRAGRAFVELFADDSKLARGLKRAQKKLAAFGESISGMGRKMALAGTVVTAPLLGAAKVFASVGGDLNDMSDRTGITVESLSELAYATKLSGTDMQTFEGGIRRMQRSISDAGRGLGTPIDALKSLGLTFEDLKDLSPEEQFNTLGRRIGQLTNPMEKTAAAVMLFGTAGQDLLPMFRQGAGGMEALRKKAAELGLTISSADTGAASALGDGMDTLWAVLKQGTFVIGSALAPMLTNLAGRIVKVVVSATSWLKQNKDLVVTVFKIATAVIAGGAALMGLGAGITALGAVIGGLVTILGAVGTAFGGVITVIGAMITPIGMAITAVAAFGTYLIIASGAGGKALAWLQARFGDLAEFAQESFGAIGQALAAGDISLAAQVLWASLKVIFQTGAFEIQKVWQNLEAWTLHRVNDIWYGARSAWEIGIHAVRGIMIRFYHGIIDIWNRLSTGVMNVWDNTIDWVSKRLVDLWGMVDHSMDTEAVKRQIDQDTRQRQNNRNEQTQTDLNQNEAAQKASLDLLAKQHEQNMSALSDAGRAADAKVDANAARAIRESQQKLADARKAWQEAIGQARSLPDIKHAEGPDRLGPPDTDWKRMFDHIGQNITARQDRISSTGTFNGLAAAGLGGGDAAERTAKATEETARNTKRMILGYAGSAFA